MVGEIFDILSSQMVVVGVGVVDSPKKVTYSNFSGLGFFGAKYDLSGNQMDFFIFGSLPP